ncbi:MAG: multidrug DMT transporter permease [Acidobacteria bacterium]|nr:MAG: multidrug DMT transporter permease [Acidobacteriota bacterium]RPJ63114.1 MAG: multidrug DMT transporter permease [Acidobacteriota bacterium]
MFVIENYAVAVFLCVLAMLCWGSWQNTYKLAGPAWRFELYYWDFAFGILLLSVVVALTLGSWGEAGRSFIPDVRQAAPGSMVSAMLGGAIWNLGTLLLTAAIAIAGMSVAFPIGGGIGWVLGIVVNYIAVPIGNPLLLFTGSACIVAAILLSMSSYKKLASQTKKPRVAGIVLSFTAGLLIAFFYRFVAAAVTTDFTNPEPGKLTTYSAVVFFCIGAFASTFLFNPIFMRKPVQGLPVSFADYFKGKPIVHLVGIVGGIIWSLGMTFSFMASGSAGFAISYGLSNSAPVVAALWGIFVWKEFARAPKDTNRLLAMMFVFYLAGLVLIVWSRYA